MTTDAPTPGRGPGKRFEKGVSGNPGGRPRIPAELRGEALAQAQALLPKAFKRIETLLNSRAPTVALAACQVVFDRALGKPETTTALTGKDGAPLFPNADELGPIERARRMAFLLTQGMRALDAPPDITNHDTPETPQ